MTPPLRRAAHFLISAPQQYQCTGVTLSLLTRDVQDMGEKPDEKFEDEEEDDVVEGDDDVVLDEIIRDLDSTKKRRAPRDAHEPAWRKLERFLEERRTAGLLTDFDDYDIDDGRRPRANGGGKRPR